MIKSISNERIACHMVGSSILVIRITVVRIIRVRPYIRRGYVVYFFPWILEVPHILSLNLVVLQAGSLMSSTLPKEKNKVYNATFIKYHLTTCFSQTRCWKQKKNWAFSLRHVAEKKKKKNWAFSLKHVAGKRKKKRCLLLEQNVFNITL